MNRAYALSLASLAASLIGATASPVTLPGTQPLTLGGDLSSQMVAGIDRFLMRETVRAAESRVRFWERDFSSAQAYQESIQPNRERLKRMLGVVEARQVVTVLEFVGDSVTPAKVSETAAFTAYAVRWPVLEGVTGEGLWLVPKSGVMARVVALSDADQTPEQICGLASGLPVESQWARRLAESGCEVLVPVVIDRSDTWSGSAALRRFTNLPHREWLWRQAFEVGRHPIGYEVQRTLAALDFFERENRALGAERPSARLGVAGWGEGGLIALYAAAVDSRVDAVLVSGYFGSRQRLWEEPIYRDVFGLLREFGDAEIAGLILPRTLVVEYSEGPKVDGPPKPREGRGGAAPGQLGTPEFDAVDAEVFRAKVLMKPHPGAPEIQFVHGTEGLAMPVGSTPALNALLAGLGVTPAQVKPMSDPPTDARPAFDPSPRLRRQFDELVSFTQRLLNASERTREKTFWKAIPAQSPDAWQAGKGPFQSNLWDRVIGRLPSSTLPLNPRSRLVEDREKWAAYDVMFDVWPDVFAWGVLLLPKELKPGERRPVVVCQHGLEGVPADTFNEDAKSGAYAAYKAFAARLAERGFVVFAPHNPYRGGDKFRVLQRKAHPLGASLFSVILGQHERILDWLSSQPFVDAQRIGFYGLSYGGKTAMRVPALLDRYCLSICSADFNEWARKCALTDQPFSYLYTLELDMYEFDLAHTFNYAEMAALVAPRPFMVERGHHDGVGVDEWVAYEYAKVRRFYAQLGIPDRTAIEFFNGPHTINGLGTFQFLHQHLQWPERGAE